MRFLVCPDSYKECLSSLDAACAIRKGLQDAETRAVCEVVPVADGGEGTVEAFLACGGREVWRQVTGPCGEPVRAQFGMLADGRSAVIEMAAAAGLALAPPQQRRPGAATTLGVGELLLAALDEGARNIVVGIGGSATNDGGAGMARALGFRLLDSAGNDIPPCGDGLLDLAFIDSSGRDGRLGSVTISAACDVTNPLTGPQGASAVFGPQKGATPEDVARLDAALERLADVVLRDLGVDMRQTPGAGAAGGLGGGLLAFCGAQLRPGFELVCEMAGLHERVRQADWVITGEGRADATSVRGKTTGSVARLCADAGRPCLVLAGSLGEGWESLYEAGATAIVSLPARPMTLREALDETPSRLREVACAFGRIATYWKEQV